MPKLSEKQKLIDFVEATAVDNWMHLTLFGKNEGEYSVLSFCKVELMSPTITEEDARKFEDDLEDATVLLACIEEIRYTVPFVHHSVPKAAHFLNDIFPHMDENRFKQFARCSRTQLKTILGLIQDDKVFDGARSGKQFPIEMQLVITLYRLGASGEGATLTKMAALFGVGDGGTIQVGCFFAMGSGTFFYTNIFADHHKQSFQGNLESSEKVHLLAKRRRT